MIHAYISTLGYYQHDSSLFDLMTVPEGLNKDDIVDEILLQTAELEVIYNDFDLFKNAIGLWSRKEQFIWQKLYDTTQLEYNPIWNVDGTEKRVISDKSVYNDHSASQSGTLNKSNTFNSAEMIDNDRSDSTATGSSSGGNKRDTVDNYERHGNIGVTSTQHLIQEERDISQFDLDQYIIDSFIKRFCLMVY